MFEGVSYNVLISIFTVIFAGIGGWYTVKGKVQQLGETVHQLAMDLASQDKTDDKLVQTLAEVRAEIKYLRRDLDEVRAEAVKNRKLISEASK